MNPSKKTVITNANIITPYGIGVLPLWKGLMSGKTAIKKNYRFPTENLNTEFAGLIPDLNVNSEKSLVMQMLEKIIDSLNLPKNTFSIIATTTGEIDFLEKGVFENDLNKISESNINSLQTKINGLFNIDEGMLISAACASSTAALAYAVNLIKSGEKECVAVIACDCVSEFVCSGFSALQAIDKLPAKPFDIERAGLTPGEAAGYIILMSEEKAVEMNLPADTFISGWGMSNDANHMTGPQREGDGLAAAIKQALQNSNIQLEEIGSVSAHGTGTVYNDLMEIKALKQCFEKPVPTYSIKGGIGHTMGASGLIEIALTIKSLEENIIPPTVNLNIPIDEAAGWVDTKKQNCRTNHALTVNAGFGGINCALVISNSGSKKP